jgi:glycosyltransferase involved in cell wall biosynthesis
LTHEQAGKKLFWLKNISDQTLQKLYEMASGILVASHGEGFGLPIVEAMHYGKSLLVRDIPVFREVAKKYQNIDYFDVEQNRLVDKIIHFCHVHLKNTQNVAIHISTWNESVLELNALFLSNQQRRSLNGN